METNMKKFEFNPNNHSYTLDSKRLTGVTTILGVIAKPFLIQWAANMAVEYIQKNFTEKLLKHPLPKKEEFDEFFKQAKTAHRTKRDKAGDMGTIVHKYCEDFINTGKIPEIKDPKEKKMFDNFYLWQKTNKVKFLGSEKKTYNIEHFFAGTYDFLCEIDGKIWLGDIKTGGTRIYPEAFFQMAGYQICEEERNPEIKINGYIVLGLFKTGKFEEKRSISNNDNKKAFLSALNLYRAMNKVSSDTLQ